MIDISQLSGDQAEIKRLVKALEKATGQKMAMLNIADKTRREAGISTRGVEIVLSGNQKVLFLVRQGGDVFRVKINDKDFPVEGHLSLNPEPVTPAKSSAVKQGGAGIVESKGFDHAMALIGANVRNGQAAFTKKLNTEKVIVPTGNRQPSVTKQLADTNDQLAELDKTIAEKTQQVADMQALVAQRNAQNAPPAVVE